LGRDEPRGSSGRAAIVGVLFLIAAAEAFDKWVSGGLGHWQIGLAAVIGTALGLGCLALAWKGWSFGARTSPPEAARPGSPERITLGAILAAIQLRCPGNYARLGTVGAPGPLSSSSSRPRQNARRCQGAI